MPTGHKYSEEFKAKVRADIDAGLSCEQVKKRWGVGYATYDRIKYGKYNPRQVIDKAKVEPPPLPGFSELRKENARLRIQNSQSLNKYDAFRELVETAARQIPNAKPVAPGKHHGGERAVQEFHAIRSDEQAGAYITAMDTSGVGGYSTAKYIEYVYRWAEKVVQFKREDMKSHGLNKLVIHRLGDWLEGEAIYPGQAFHIDQPIVQCITQTILPHEREVMRMLAAEFEEIEQFCVIGNHGRAGKKGDHHPLTSFEMMLYLMHQMMMADQPNVKTFISQSLSMLVQHGKYVFCLDHGGHLKSNYSVPYYHMDRTFKAIQTLYGMKIDLYLVGHKHTPSNLADHVMMNGSMMGGSDLSVNVMKVAEVPSQKIFYFDQDHGPHRESNLYLEEPLHMQADGDGIFTPHV